MNRVDLIGRTTADIHTAMTQGGTVYTRFTLAVNRLLKNGERSADFISCQAYGKSADILSRFVKKGNEVGISGNIRTGSYEKDGRKVYTTEVLVDRVYLLNNGGHSTGAGSGAGANSAIVENVVVEDEDLPF